MNDETMQPSGSKEATPEKSSLRLKVAGLFSYVGFPVEYVPQDCYDHVRNYQYCGTDLSPVYQYLLKPIAKACVSVTPPTVAPNIITLAGFACTAITLVIGLCITDKQFTTPAPSWYAALSAVSIFVYQTLDNMDGIQARKTGSSSPLGQLFDHGIDAMNATVLILIIGINSANGGVVLYISIIMTMTTFFCTTWEEYATGAFTLGFVNGPDDGLLGCSLMLALSALIGPVQFWTYQVPVLGYQLNQMMCPALVLAGVTTVILQLVITYRSFPEGFHKSLPALGSLAIFLSLFFLAAWRQTIHGGPQVIAIVAGGSVFGLMMCRLILSHVCHKKVAVLQREHVLMLPAVILPGYGTIVSLLLGVVSAAHYAIVAIDDFCVCLNVNAFSLKKVPPSLTKVDVKNGN